jgi:hypothetical protein
METAALASFAKTLDPSRDPLKMSMNYAQALPGTPLYEFARRRGLIGPTIDDEEKYLLDISDKNAADLAVSLNFTNSPEFIRQSWRLQLVTRVAANYQRRFGREAYLRILSQNPNFLPLLKGRKQAGDNMVVDRGADLMQDPVATEGEARMPGLWELLLKRNLGLVMLLYPQFFDRMRFLTPLRTLVRLVVKEGPAFVIKDILAYTVGSRRRLFDFNYMSLRKIVDNDIAPVDGDAPEMQPLRKGR